MRIAYDSQAFCMQPYGGVSRYCTRIAEQIQISGEDVVICAPLHRNRYLRELPAQIVEGRYISSYPPKTTDLLGIINQVAAKWLIKRWQPDLLHETYYSAFTCAPKSCPTVITVYDMVHELFPDSFLNHEKITVLKRAAINRADQVICISENTRRDLLRLFDICPQKVSVVYLGFDKFLAYDNRSRGNSALDKYATAPYLLFVGNRGGYKNFDNFLKAIAVSGKLMKDFHVVAFGGGGFNRSERSLMHGLGFRPDQAIQIQGDDQTLSYFYRRAAAFIYPSLYEGFGLPPLEAMANQCPVVSSNSSSLPEVVGDAGALFDPTAIDSIKTAIESVVYSQTYANELVARGEKRLNCFTWGSCAEQTLKIYRSLVNG